MLQRISKATAFASLTMLVLSTILLSFSNKMGGDVFEVYINKKLAFRQYVHNAEAVKSLQFDQHNYDDLVEVYYSHCGQTGTSRAISIRDSQNKVLKEWRFQDTPGAKSSMACSGKDIVGLQKLTGNNTLNLYYSSHELPAGKLLVSLVVANTARTAP